MSTAAAAGMAGLLVFYWIFAIAAYVYLALCLQTIARKLNAKDTWMAWVPVLNIYLMCMLARKPAWWIVLFFVPVANIIVAIIVWMAIAEARGRPNWWGVLISLIPIANIIMLGLLAFQDAGVSPAAPTPPAARI